MSYHNHQPRPLTQRIEIPTDFTNEMWVDYLTEDKVDTTTSIDLEPRFGVGRSYHVIRIKRFRIGKHDMTDELEVFTNARFPDDQVIEIKTFG